MLRMKVLIGQIILKARIVAKVIGYALSRCSMAASLRRSRTYIDASFSGTVIDVGASDGRWSQMASKYFKRCHFHLVEAQKVHEKSLKALSERFDRFTFSLVAAGESDGFVHFDISDAFGGGAYREPIPGRTETVPMKKLDTLVDRMSMQPPFILKLDTHGYEVPIFEGASGLLKDTQLIIVESYNFKLVEGCLRFHELCAFLEERGFRCVDICEPMHRVKDDVFWQMDMFFIPATSPVFQYNQYE